MTDSADAHPSAAASSSYGSTTTTRLHVSGLNPTQCSLDDIKARFRSFGLNVSDVHNWPPKQDAVDKTTDWCFVTVTGEDSGVKRSMGVLNGTMWKGAKLRIGHAKRRQWQQAADGATEKEVEKQRIKDERKALAVKRRRGIVGRESDDVATPVTVAKVEDKEPWGWNKTRGGHLVRPLHMRPDHPLPRPAVTQAEESTKDSATKDKKRRRSKSAVVKPLSRAKRITIDPTRYGAAHISGTMMLEDGSIQAAPAGHEWRCQESGDGATATWTLHDAQGEVVRQEKVQLRTVSDAIGHASESDESFEDDDDEEQDDDVLAEIDAAIDNAIGEEADSDNNEDAEESSQAEQAEPMVAEAQQTFPVFPHYDPAEDDAFSDGYQEAAGAAIESTSTAVDWVSEKSGQLDLLKSLFGAKALEVGAPVQQIVPSSPPSEGDADDEIEEDKPVDTAPIKSALAPAKETVELQPKSVVTEGTSRRAALLTALQPATKKQQSHFQPIVRFDPAAASGAGVQDDDHDDGEAAQQENGAPVADSRDVHMSAERAEDRVEMDKLTDMFRPKQQDANAGFSLMADLDLDLDDDLNFEPELDDDDDGDVRDVWSLHQQDLTQRDAHDAEPASTTTSVHAPFVVPRYDAAGAMLTAESRNIFAVLMQEQREAAKTDALEASFYRVDDEQTLTRKWDERKAELTQAYKRRHREALKKKKRKFTGSRAAGTALPGRRVA